MIEIRLFADLCGTEIWNVERTKAYMDHGVSPAGARYRGRGCPALVDLVPLFTDEPPVTGGYQLPELDPAPWYDPLVPESRSFAGAVVTDAALNQPLDRDFLQSVGPGGTITYPRLRGRTLDVKATLFGKTCCSVRYGLSWLTQAMLGTDADACDDCDLSFLSCCPSSDEDGCLFMLVDDQLVPYYRDGGDEEWTRGLDMVRQLKGVGLLQAPTVVGYSRGGCGCGCGVITQVEFTLAASLPWVTTLGSTVGAADTAVGPCPDDDCVVFVKCSEEEAATGCPSGSPCEDDPACADGDAVAPPLPPSIRVSCGCVSLAALRTWFEVPPSSAWFPQALKVELSAGSDLMRNVVLRLFSNPDGLDCVDGSFLDCEAVGTVIVDYVPAGGVFTFDSASRRATTECDGRTRRADGSLITVDGLPFNWLELGAGRYCLAVDTDCANLAADATATVTAYRREL